MIYIILLFIGLSWAISFIFQNDFSLPTKALKKYKKILIIFPHPDDEVLTVGGLTASCRNFGIETIVTVLTKGERGESYIKDVSDLKSLRAHEMETSFKILGGKRLIQLDLGDGDLENNKKVVKEEIKRIIKVENPDLIITYDLAGLYGHPDHIVLSETITELRTDYHYDLWYAVLPKRIMKTVTLPEHMARDPNFKSKRALPTHRIFVGVAVLKKIKALYAYRSQYMSFRNAYPFKFIPLGFYVSANIYEYFHEVN